MNLLFLVLVALLAAGFVSDLILDLLNIRHIQADLPGVLSNRYDRGSYRNSQTYLKEHGRFGILASTVGFATVLLMLLLSAFSWLDDQVFSFASNPILTALLFFGILGLASDIAGTPFEIYSVFVIEEKYGFNKTSPKTFIADKLKSWLLALVVGAPLMALIIWIFSITGKWFWVIAWMVISAFSILLSFFYSTLIVPLFNKQKPLEDGQLRDAIGEMSRKAGFPVSRIFVIDGSKRSTKANAYFAGFGSRRRIVLFDTLIKDLTLNQILAVLAHEIGHYKKKHIITTMILSVVQTGILLFLFSLIARSPALAESLNVTRSSFHISVLVFAILFSPVSMLTGLFINYLSRRFEYQADGFAASLGFQRDLADALISLSEKNLGNLTPHPAYVFVHYSHPPLLKRIKKLAE